MKVRIVLIFGCLYLFGCTDKIVNTIDEAPYVPQVDNQWIVESDSSRVFSLSSEDDGFSIGTINGTEFRNDFSEAYDLTGAFYNKHMFIKVDYNTSSLRYEGTFIADNRIQMFSTKDTIVISHN